MIRRETADHYIAAVNDCKQELNKKYKTQQQNDCKQELNRLAHEVTLLRQDNQRLVDARRDDDLVRRRLHNQVSLQTYYLLGLNDCVLRFLRR